MVQEERVHSLKEIGRRDGSSGHSHGDPSGAGHLRSNSSSVGLSVVCKSWIGLPMVKNSCGVSYTTTDLLPVDIFGMWHITPGVAFL